MNILYFQGLGEPDSPRVELSAVTRYNEDRSMAEFDGIELSHVELDDVDNVTVYSKNGFYITLNRADVAQIAQASGGLKILDKLEVEENGLATITIEEAHQVITHMLDGFGAEGAVTDVLVVPGELDDPSDGRIAAVQVLLQNLVCWINNFDTLYHDWFEKYCH